MFRTSLSLLLILAVTCISIPAQAQEITQETNLTQEEFEAAFEAELYAYAATHTNEELVAYTQERINQMTNEAVAYADATTSANPLSAVISAEVLYGHSDDSFASVIYTDVDRTEDKSSLLKYCLATRYEECRRLYNAELFASAAAASAIAAGCIALTAGGGFVLCLAAAAAAHAAGIAAALEHLDACKIRATSDCYLAYGGGK